MEDITFNNDDPLLGDISVLEGNIVRYEKAEAPLNPESIRRFDEVLQEIAAQMSEPPFLLVDIRHGHTPDPSIRRSLVEILDHTKLAGVAMFGGPKVIRDVLQFIFRLGETPLEFFETEAEALEWIREKQSQESF